ncbi:PAS domain protein [Roseovarius litorisediminis]|uniref:PAS domain protein n=1 Tax=Roseovarius litorisediminis TaxID=1312363 RepID=A0A1Y5RBC5_9RHOB|nr:PAS domain-containing protein [Roseovarius litorisediminis]SLN12318.1 PAS domain protein [Roseovarius litorisediminis]
MHDDQKRQPFPDTVVKFRGDRTSAKTKDIDAFRAYWQSMRKSGDVPWRSDIDPRGIEGLLENAFIAENIAPGVTRLRIAGSHLSDLMGMEVRGMPLSAFVDPGQRKDFALQLVELFDRPATLHLKLRSDGGIGRPVIESDLVLLPLRSDLGDISRALGCLVTKGNIGRAPRRFNIASTTLEPLDTGSPGLMAESMQGPGMAETGHRFEHRPANPSEKPYLRLVK